MRHLILIAALTLCFARAYAADEKVPQTMDEINADLQARKEALEPFDEKKVKIDVESLGLDDVDKKPEEKAPVPVAVPANPVPTPRKDSVPVPAALPAIPTTPTPPPAAEKPATPAPAEAVPEGGVLEKIQTLIQKTADSVKKDEKNLPLPQVKPESLPTTNAADIKKPTEKYINSKKKENLKKRLEAEKRRKKHDSEDKVKLKKLNELREKYLRQAEKTFQLNNKNTLDDDSFDDEEKIIPHRKNLSPFLSDELPAAPILNRYRSLDNINIPIIPTPKERVDLLFDIITIGSVSAFNEDFKDIQNPNARNSLGDTILTYSVLLRKYPIIASVLTKGANPNLPNRLGYNPVDIAIEMLDMRSLELLANNKADLNERDAFGRTYLMHAARVGFLPAVELFISQGVDVNAMDNDGFTALAIAYRHRKEIIVQYLLKHGAEPWIEKPYSPEEQSILKELENRWE